MKKTYNNFAIWELPSDIAKTYGKDEYLLNHNDIEGKYYDNMKSYILKTEDHSTEIPSFELVPFYLPDDELVDVVREMFSDGLYYVNLKYPTWEHFLRTEGKQRNPTTDEVISWIEEQIMNPYNIFNSVRVDGKIIGYHGAKKIKEIPENIKNDLPEEQVELTACLLKDYHAHSYAPLAAFMTYMFMFQHKEMNSVLAVTRAEFKYAHKALKKIHFHDITDNLTHEEIDLLSNGCFAEKETKAFLVTNPKLNK